MFNYKDMLFEYGEYGYACLYVNMNIDQAMAISEGIYNEIKKILGVRNPLSLRIMTLLDKPDRRVVELKADYSLFTIPDYFVIGYGLDYGEFYRNLPYIAEFSE